MKKRGERRGPVTSGSCFGIKKGGKEGGKKGKRKERKRKKKRKEKGRKRKGSTESKPCFIDIRDVSFFLGTGAF